jgi:hypothetical protein
MSLKISDLLSGDSSKESVQMGNLRQILATTPNAEEVLGEDMPTVMSKLIEILSGTGKSSFSTLFFLFLFFWFFIEYLASCCANFSQASSTVCAACAYCSVASELPDLFTTQSPLGRW